MSNDDQWRDDFSDEETFSPIEEPPKKGMNTTVKVLLILSGIAGVGVLVCCGGIFLWFRSIQQGLTEVPAEVAQRTQEIITIEIPDRFKPKAAMKMNMMVMQMSMVVYEPTEGEGALMLFEIDMPDGGDPEAQRQQMQQAMGRQGQGGHNLSIDSSESRDFEIDGQTVKFLFSKATDTNDQTDFRQVTGSLPGRNGTVYLTLQIDAEHYDEEATVKMLESISVK